MRKSEEINKEIRRCRLVFQNHDFPEKARDAAWTMMLTLQWVKTTHKDMSLSPMELCGITMEQANAIKKLEKQTNLPRVSIRTCSKG